MAELEECGQNSVRGSETSDLRFLMALFTTVYRSMEALHAHYIQPHTSNTALTTPSNSG